MSDATDDSPAAESFIARPAANADRFDRSLVGVVANVEMTVTTSGWDAHEVWRRLIKEARDRRRSRPEG